MTPEVAQYIAGADQGRKFISLSTGLSPETPAQSWYKGSFLLPSPADNIHAIFNGPLARIGGKIIHLPRVMNRKQIPGVADRTAYFGLYELGPISSEVITHPPIELRTITGDNPAYSLYGIEDIRTTTMDDGSLGCTATAEFNGKPYPARFFIHAAETGFKIDSMELMLGAGMGKNTLLLDRNTALHRLETDSDRISVIQKDPQTNRWNTIDYIHFPHIAQYNEDAKQNGGGSKRVGLTGGERIPMPNGNFRMIIHEVTHTGNGYEDISNISEYSFRLAEFRLDEQGIPRVVTTDPNPLLTYDQVIALAGPGQEPDPKKRVIYSVGGVIDHDQFLLPVTVRDREEHLFSIPLTDLQLPFDNQLVLTSQRRGRCV